MAAAKQKYSKEMSEGIKVLAKATVDNMLFLKRQQWTITNYALILDAAVMALARGAGEGGKTLCTVLAVLGCGFAMFCVNHTQHSLTRYYSNLFDLYAKYLTAKERALFRTVEERPTYYHNWIFVVGLFGVNLIALCVTCYVIWIRGGLPFMDPTSPAGNKSSQAFASAFFS